MSRYFSKFIVVSILFLISYNLYSLDIFYKKLYPYFENPSLLKEKKVLKYVEKIGDNDKTSAKWLAFYILYKYYIDINDKKAFFYLKKIYFYSYIESEDVINDFIRLAFKYGKYEIATDALLDNTYYYDKRLLEYKKYLLKFMSVKDYVNLIYSKGFYSEVLKYDITKCLKLKCLYGLRKFKDIIAFFKKNTKAYYDNTALFFLAKSYASLNNYKKAVFIMKKIKKINDYKKYYLALYEFKVDKNKALAILKSIKNLYYKAKLIDYVFKKNLFNKKVRVSLYNLAMDDKFVSSKIYFFYGKRYGLRKPKYYDISVFNNLDFDFSKFVKINSLKNYYVCYDKVLKKYVRKNVYIVYNDIMLTKYKSKIDKIKDFYISDLPYFGLRLSYSLRGKYVFFKYPLAYYDLVVKYSKKYKVSPFLIWAIMKSESSFKWDISERGAGGVMQIMPGTYSWIKNRFKMDESENKIENNIKAGILYFKYLNKKFNNDFFLAILAYNGGPGNVKRWFKKYKSLTRVLKHIPYFESERYLYKVFFNYMNYLRFYSKSFCE